MAEPFRIVETETEPKSDPLSSVGLQTLMLGLKALSQRALASLATVSSVGVVFWLYFSISKDPSINQLILLAMFSVFVLACVWIIRRK